MTPCEGHSGIVSEIKQLKATDDRHEEAISNLQNRLPVWATILLSVLTFALGCTLTYASLAVQMAKMAK